MSKRFYGAKFPDGKECVFTSWNECNQEIKGVSNVVFKGFDNQHEMKEWFEKQRIVHSSDESFKDTFLAYVDGSYNSKEKNAGWGFVIVKNDEFYIARFGTIRNANENGRQIVGELYATVYAARLAKQLDIKIVVVHDYSGIGNFAVGNWTPHTQVAKGYVEKIAPLMDNILLFHKIPGHSNNRWNDYADELAKKGCGVI